MLAISAWIEIPGARDGWVLIEIDPAVKALKPGGILSSADAKP